MKTKALFLLIFAFLHSVLSLELSPWDSMTLNKAQAMTNQWAERQYDEHCTIVFVGEIDHETSTRN